MRDGVSEFHAEVAGIALRAAGPGWMLAGGNALLAHGIGHRPTMDVDLVTATPMGVRQVREAVENALRAAAFTVTRTDAYTEDDDAAGFRGDMAADVVEWTVSRGGIQVVLDMMVEEPRRDPVTMGFGPVMAVEDLLGSKLRAAIDRSDVRDFIDLAAALGQHTPAQLIGWAREQEPGWADDDFARIPLQLAEIEDEEFAFFGLDEDGVARLRERFATWPGPGAT